MAKEGLFAGAFMYRQQPITDYFLSATRHIGLGVELKPVETLRFVSQAHYPACLVH